MSRPLEDILFGAPSPRAQTVARVASHVAAASVLLLLAVGIAWRFPGQLDAKFWTFFTLPTTWAFLAQGFLGTLASAASAGVMRDRWSSAGRRSPGQDASCPLAERRAHRIPAWHARRCCSSTSASWCCRKLESS